MKNIFKSIKLHYDKNKRVHKEYGSYYSDHAELYRKKYVQQFGLMPKELQLLVLEHYFQKGSCINW